MTRYTVQIVKESSEIEEEINNDYGKRYSFSKFDEEISHPNLSVVSQDKITQVLQNFFRKMDRGKIRTSVEFNKKERVIINEVNNPGFEEAVYDKKTKIPKHLRKPLKVKNDG